MQIFSSGEYSHLRKVLCLKAGAHSVLGTNLNEPIRQMLVKITLFCVFNHSKVWFCCCY